MAQSKALEVAEWGLSLPALVAAAGERASQRFVEFSTANIRNPNTRQAHGGGQVWRALRGPLLLGLSPVSYTKDSSIIILLDLNTKG